MIDSELLHDELLEVQEVLLDERLDLVVVEVHAELVAGEDVLAEPERLRLELRLVLDARLHHDELAAALLVGGLLVVLVLLVDVAELEVLCGQAVGDVGL